MIDGLNVDLRTALRFIVFFHTTGLLPANLRCLPRRTRHLPLRLRYLRLWLNNFSRGRRHRPLEQNCVALRLRHFNLKKVQLNLKRLHLSLKRLHLSLKRLLFSLMRSRLTLWRLRLSPKRH